MPQQALHPLDRKEASARSGRMVKFGLVGAVLAGIVGWFSMNQGPTEPLEIDALIAPPLYTNGALFPLTQAGNLPADPPRILTLEPGARLMLRIKNAPDAPQLVWRDTDQKFSHAEDGTYWLTLTIDDPGVLSLRQGNGVGHDWLVSLTPDDPPRAGFVGKPFVTARQMLRFDIAAEDDFGLAGLELTIAPASDTDLGDIEPISIALSPADLNGPFRDTVYTDLRDHPLAGDMARVWLTATDRRGQKSLSEPLFMRLPERRYSMAEARILASQPGKLRTNPGKTAEVATILHTIASRHMEDDNIDAGQFLGFAVAYKRLTGLPLLTDRAFRPPMIPASKQQIDEASPLIMALATEIEDGKLAETDPLFMTADRGLQDKLGPDAAPEDQEVALWQYRYALSRHLPSLLLTSLGQHRAFLPAPLGSNPKQAMIAIDRLAKEIGQDIAQSDWQRARARQAVIRDIIHNAQAGTITVERSDLLGLIAETGALLAQTKQLQKEAMGDVSRLANRSANKNSDAVTVLPFKPLTKTSAIARAEALYYRANRRLSDARISALLPIMAENDKGAHIQARHALDQAQSAFAKGRTSNAISYLGQAGKHMAALTQSAINSMLAQATNLPPTPVAVRQGRALNADDYDRFLSLLSAHRDFTATAQGAANEDHAAIGAQFTQAMNYTDILPQSSSPMAQNQALPPQQQ